MDWRRIYFWLVDHEPVFCAICGHLIFRKDAKPTPTLSGQVVDLCSPCHSKWFYPEER